MSDTVRITSWLEQANGHRLPLSGSITIGRSSKNKIVLDGPMVSRRHALIQAQDVEEHWLVDLGSSNGTRLNNRRVTQPTPLRSADVIEIGGHVYRFQQMAPGTAGGRIPDRTQSGTTAREIRDAQCWLLVADIRGFNKLSQTLPPDALAQLVGGWLGSCAAIIRDCQGAINKYLGDGFLAYWSETDHTTRDVLAALTDLRQLQKQGHPAFRLVLHHGTLTIGGVPAGGEESLLGKEVNFIFRMEKVASEMKLECLYSEAAAQKLEGSENLVAIAERSVPGFDGMFKFFTV